MTLPTLNDPEMLFRTNVIADFDRRGQIATVGKFTILANDTTTVVTDDLVRAGDAIFWNASDFESSRINRVYVSAVADGQFTVESSSRTEDRVYDYMAVVGPGGR